jgi:hypothetical protein
MKRLLILTAVSLSAGALGCKCCGLCGGGAPTAVYRPPCPTPACGAGATYGSAPGGYVVPGATSTPVLTVPQTVPTYPGPEAYTPAN